MLLGLAACGPASEPEKATTEAAVPPEEAGYVAPPALVNADRSQGRVRIGGVAPPGAEIRLASPDGTLLRALAAADGRWSLSLPEPTSPVMFAFSAVSAQRTIRSEGAVLSTPSPGPPALLLRAGFGAQPLGSGQDQPVILAVDYDGSGGAAVAGLARARSAVRLSLDGAPAGFGQTDQAGRFAVIATNRTLAPGPRRIEVETPEGRAQVAVTASAPRALGASAYRAERVGAAWRIDWAPPGGGVQTSIVFDPPEPQG